MAVLPVTLLNNNSGRQNVSFGQKRTTDNPIEQQGDKKAGSMVTIPTALFIALATTALSNGVKAETKTERNANTTELVESPQQYATAVAKPYKPDPEKLLYSKHFVQNGQGYNMYYMNLYKHYNNNSKNVSEVTFVEDGYKQITVGTSKRNRPWFVKTVVYHDLGDPEHKDFIGVIMERITCDSQGENRGWQRKEIRVPDDIGTDLINFLNGDTQFKCTMGKGCYKEVMGATLEKPTSGYLK